MGWSCKLKADNIILTKDIDAIVNNLPHHFWMAGIMKPSRQTWGWSAGADIINPDDKEMTISGSYAISGSIAEDFVNYVKDMLVEKGYKIDLEFDID